jgi:hypothetical protein
VRKRKSLVQDFQEDERIPFFVLSLKAGGSDLNLTAAAHVVHLDRCWNPTVENRATDRAFRIGQKQNVLVHKFICRGTVEEKIDAPIESKGGLSRELLDGSAEVNLTELGNGEILRLVSLGLHTAMKERPTWASANPAVPNEPVQEPGRRPGRKPSCQRHRRLRPSAPPRGKRSSLASPCSRKAFARHAS